MRFNHTKIFLVSETMKIKDERQIKKKKKKKKKKTQRVDTSHSESVRAKRFCCAFRFYPISV